MIEPKIENLTELERVLARVSFVNSVLDFKWRFETARFDSMMGDAGFFVWVTFERPDTNTGVMSRGTSRKELVAQGSYLSSVVKTAWLLLELTIRHELMEGFRFDDQRVFNPHNSVFDLANLQRDCMVDGRKYLNKDM